MNSILITGCNRGLGLGLIRKIINWQTPAKFVIGTCRNIDQATELRELAQNNKNIHILQLDVTKTDTFEEFAKNVSSIIGEDGLNVLFNNAGYAPKSTRINSLKAEQLAETFAINTIGPIMLTKALLPELKKAANVNSSLSLCSQKAAVINMSSLLGSNELNREGGLYPYRCSKAALNMATKSLSIDLKKDGILVTCIHPGWVKTEMGGLNAVMEIEASCLALAKFIEQLTDKHNGKFFQWDGKELPW